MIVSINGGGDVAGAGGGINQISITAGGTVRSEIAANSVQGAPTFVEARSRCGGPMTLVIDESNSIGASITDVKAGVRTFVEALAGTPVQAPGRALPHVRQCARQRPIGTATST